MHNRFFSWLIKSALALTLIFTLTANFSPALAQEGPIPQTPLFDGLTWQEGISETRQITVNEEALSLSGTVLRSSEPFNVEESDTLMSFYSSTTLAVAGWKYLATENRKDGASTLYFHEAGYFLSVDLTVCGETSSIVCLSVWQSDFSSLKPTFPAEQPAPASAFVKQTPVNGATNLATSGVVISWSAYTGANFNHYRYCIDNTNDNKCDQALGWTSVWSGTSATLPTLSASRTYYWQIQAVLNDTTKVDADSGVYWNFTTLYFANFGKISPTNNASGLTPNVTLSWQSNPSAAGGYRYCISEASVNCTTWTTTSSTSVNLTLSPSKTYKWQVRAYDGAGGTGNYVDADTGTWWQFSTVNVRNFSKSAPVNNAANQAIITTLSWNSNPDASGGYKYCISEDGVACINWLATSNTSIQVALQPKKTYQWQVRAYNASGGYNEADSGVWWKFNTVQIANFNKTAPANGAAGQSGIATLQWAANPDASGGYKYCISPLNTSCTNWVAPSPASSTSVSVNLNPQTTYQWQVRAYNSAGNYIEADSGSWWTFSTLNLAAFSKTSPANGASGLAPTVTLQWSPSPSAAKYQYCVAVSTSPTCTFVDASPVTATSATLTLAPKTTYKWQVRALDGSGNSLEANAYAYWTFSTVNMATFGKAAPANNRLGVSPFVTFTLSWAANPDAAAGYQYCLAQDGQTCSVWTSTSATSFTIPAGTLAMNKTYTWQVRALNGSGTSIEADNGSWWKFSTIKKRGIPDFNGDGLTDYALFRASTGTWYLRGIGTVSFGASGDIPVAADYNGDGKTEVAVFRPSNQTYYIKGLGVRVFGANDTLPVPGDYNGDGIIEAATFDPSAGIWKTSPTDPGTTYGQAGDIPVPADYNGDGKVDLAVYRPGTGVWYIKNVGTFVFNAASGDTLAPADYDGDGKANMAYFHPGTGAWYIRNSNGSDTIITYGAAGDLVLPTDFNGDGKTEVAVYRPSSGQWFARGISVLITYGGSLDTPITGLTAIVP